MRYHGLDFLRAAMMLLGIVIHAGVLYMPYPHENDTVSILADSLNSFRDIEGYNMVAQRSVFLIHFFRMPAFMLLAGFFAALLLKNRGNIHFFKNRGQRILVPLILFFFMLWPIDSFSWSLGKAIMSNEIGHISLLQIIQNTFTWKHLPFLGDTAPHTMHLWFIYYLVIFYLVSVPIICSCSIFFSNLSCFFKRITDFIFTSRLKITIIPCLVVLSYLTLRSGTTFHFEVSFKFLPSITILINFIVFFLTGWVLYACKEVIEHFKMNVWFYTTIAVCLMLAMLWASETHWHYEKLLIKNKTSPELINKESTYLNLATGIQAACVWFVIFSLVGLTEKYISKSNPVTSYFVDSSYWVYLIHRPFCTLIAVILTQWDAPGMLKFFIVILTVFAICTVSYHYLVRSTWIGFLLNGKKKPREFPFSRCASE